MGGLTACGDKEPDTEIEFSYIAEELNISEDELEKRDVKTKTIDKFKKVAEKYYQLINTQAPS